MSALPHYGADPHVLRLSKILRGLLDRETFTSLADLKDAFATELARRYHIRYTGPDLDAAFEVVGSNRPLVSSPPRLRATPLPQESPSEEILDRLISDLDVSHLVKSMPKAYTHDRAHELRVRAQADQWRARSDPADECVREQRAQAEERIAWERTQGAK